MTVLESEVDSVANKVGTTDDSDGSQTAGSVMAKQNKALADLAELGINVNSIISKLVAGMAAKGIKRVESCILKCAYTTAPTTIYWPSPFTNEGLAIFKVSNDHKGLPVIAAIPKHNGNGAVILLTSEIGLRRIDKSGFSLEKMSATGGTSGTVSMLITLIEFN